VKQIPEIPMDDQSDQLILASGSATNASTKGETEDIAFNDCITSKLKHKKSIANKSCKRRYYFKLRDFRNLENDMSKKEFSVEEKETIIRLFKEIGSRWVVIAKQLPGR
jgi:hypothetical protein